MAVLRLFLGNLVVLAGLAALLLAPGALNVDGLEGDLMHTVDGVLRMAAGDSIHRDFETPLGWMAFAPIALWTDWGIGRALLLGGVTVAAALLPFALWVGWSRGIGLWPSAAIWLAGTPAWGGAVSVTAMAMHYNRWAWAIAWLILLQCLLPRTRGDARLDGVAVGLGMAALALIKASFAVALLPVALLALPGRALIAGVGAGLLALGAATLWLGPGMWPAYVAQLIEVATSPMRPSPGPGLDTYVTGAVGGPAIALGLAAVVLWRRGGMPETGRIAMVAVPLMVLVTWQNWGAEPLFLAPLALALAVLPVPGGRLVAALAVGLILPSLVTLALAPVRHLNAGPDYLPILPGRDDLRIAANRYPTSALMVGDTGSETEPLALGGTEIPDCGHLQGYAGHQQAVADEIAAWKPGASVLVADLSQPFWLFADLARVPGVALWNYGGAPGLEAAEALAVPRCPRNRTSREAVVTAAGEGWQLASEGPRVLIFTRGPAPDN